MIVCPVCRAENAQSGPCRRCKADLSLLFELEVERDRCLSVVRSAVLNQDWETAQTALDEAMAIREDTVSKQLRVAVLFARGHFAQATQEYLQLQR